MPGTPGFIVGLVVDKTTMQPIRRALIRVWGQKTRSRKDGSFMMMVPAGQKVVRVRRWRYKPAKKTVQVPPGQVVFVEFVLERMANV